MYTHPLTVRQRMHNSPDGARFTDEVQLGLLKNVLNKRDDAEQLIQDASSMLESDPAKDIPRCAKVEFALGAVLTSKGRYIEAEPHLKSAASLQNSSPELKADLADTVAELSNLQLHLGHYDEADRANRQLLELDLELYGRYTVRALDAFQNLGTSAYIRGDLGEAERYQRSALDVAEAWFGTSHRMTANQMISLANVLTDEGKLVEAWQLLHAGIALEKKVYPPDSVFLGKAQHYLGRFQAASGQSSAAISNFDRAEAIFKKNRGPNDFMVGVVLLSKGETHQKMGDLVRAETAFRSALRIVLGVRGVDDIYTALARVHLGHTLLLEKRTAEAIQLTQEGLDGLKRIRSISAVPLNTAEQDLAAEHESLNQAGGAQSRRQSGTVQPL